MSKKILLILISGCFLIGILCLFNTEKLYSEFWLQKKIKAYPGIEQLDNVDLTGEVLIYKFYDDSVIDVEISLYNKGYVTLGINKWFKDNPNIKIYTFKTDKNEIKSLINDFKNSYTQSEFSDVEDHLGGRYYAMEYQGDNSIEIGFYNTNPDERFKSIKNKLIRIAYDVLNQLQI